MLDAIFTDRLVIREVTQGDKIALFENILHDKLVLRYFIGKYAETIDEVKIQPILDKVKQGQYHYAVSLKDQGTIIGFIFEQKRSVEKNSIEIGYALGSKYWRNGYATEMVKAVIQELFNKGFKTIESGFLMENAASKHVLEKAGMKFDYVGFKEVAYHYEKHDVVYYKIERDD